MEIELEQIVNLTLHGGNEEKLCGLILCVHITKRCENSDENENSFLSLLLTQVFINISLGFLFSVIKSRPSRGIGLEFLSYLVKFANCHVLGEHIDILHEVLEDCLASQIQNTKQVGQMLTIIKSIRNNHKLCNEKTIFFLLSLSANSKLDLPSALSTVTHIICQSKPLHTTKPSKFCVSNDLSFHLRSTMVQCLHGAAPERVRDCCFHCFCALLSSGLNSDWMIESSGKQQSGTYVGQFASLISSVLRNELHVLIDEGLTLFGLDENVTDTSSNKSDEIVAEIGIKEQRENRVYEMSRVVFASLESLLGQLVGDGPDTDGADSGSHWQTLPNKAMSQIRQSLHGSMLEIFDMLKSLASVLAEREKFAPSVRHGSEEDAEGNEDVFFDSWKGLDPRLHDLTLRGALTLSQWAMEDEALHQCFADALPHAVALSWASDTCTIPGPARTKSMCSQAAAIASGDVVLSPPQRNDAELKSIAGEGGRELALWRRLNLVRTFARAAASVPSGGERIASTHIDDLQLSQGLGGDVLQYLLPALLAILSEQDEELDREETQREALTRLRDQICSCSGLVSALGSLLCATCLGIGMSLGLGLARSQSEDGKREDDEGRWMHMHCTTLSMACDVLGAVVGHRRQDLLVLATAEGVEAFTSVLGVGPSEVVRLCTRLRDNGAHMKEWRRRLRTQIKDVKERQRVGGAIGPQQLEALRDQMEAIADANTATSRLLEGVDTILNSN